MKKHLFPLFTAASMLFATSCSEEELTYENGNKQNVTFKVAVEGAGASSRTILNPDDSTEKIYIGQGEMVDKLFYAVYESDLEKKSKCLLEGQATVANGVATVIIPLVNGLEYDLVFLAYNNANNAFDIPSTLTFQGGLCSQVDLENLTLKSTLLANKEAYDAFYHVKSNYVTNNSSTTPVELHRMFAQLNVATTDEDLRNAAQLDVNVTKTALELKNVPNQFNARTGQVGENGTDVLFAASAILKCADNPDKHEILAVKKDGENEYFNYLAMAYVLADKGKSLHDVNVSFYRKEESTPFHTRTIPSVPLQRQYRTNITGNILTQQEAFSISLDTTFINREYNESVGDVVVVATAERLEEAIKNAQQDVPVEIQINGNITLGEETTQNRSATINKAALNIGQTQHVIIDLNGYTLSTKLIDEQNGKHDYAFSNQGILTIKDSKGTGSIKARGIYNYGNMTLESGTIDAVDGNGGYGILNYEGAEFTMNGGSIITSYKDDDAPENGYDATTLRVETDAKAIINGGIINNTQNYTFAIDNSGETTVNGGTIISVHTTIANKGDITINDGSFTCDGLENITAHVLWANAGTATINGGTFDGKDNYNGFNVNASKDATVYIKGGKFLNVHSGSLYGEGTIVVSGGEFFDNPSECLAEGCVAEQNENNVWVVKQVLIQDGENSYVINDLAGLKAFRDAVNNGNSFAGFTIKLNSDIDMHDEEWIPIGNGKHFMGTLDGNNHTIYGLKITQRGDARAALIGTVSGTVAFRNLTIKNASIKCPDFNGDFYGSALIGTAYGDVTIENVDVVDSYISGNNKVGALLAHDGVVSSLKINECDVFNTTFEALNNIDGGSVGGLVGYFQGVAKGAQAAPYGEHEIANSTVKNCTFNVVNSTNSGKRANAQLVGGLNSKENQILNINNCDVKNNTWNEKFYVNGSEITIDTFVSPYGILIGGERNDDPKGKVIIDGWDYIADGVCTKEEEYSISTTNGMFWFANEVNNNKNAFNGKTVKLAANIDLKSRAWTPIGQTGATTFNGVFDGQNYTICNVNVNSEAQTGANYSSGLFGWVESHTAGHGHIKNVKINGATINGHHNCGALVGYITAENALVENCHVTSATISCTSANNDANGDKAGALIGNATVETPVKNCTATNSTVNAGRDAGQVIGAAKEANVTGCSATEVIVSANGTSTGANVRNEVIGRLLNE